MSGRQVHSDHLAYPTETPGAALKIDTTSTVGVKTTKTTKTTKPARNE
jgi:hypothetical protein